MTDQKEPKGVIYYNIGFGSFVRMAVSLNTCRRHYSGPITILCDETSFNDCKKLQEIISNLDIKVIPYSSGPHSIFLEKCRLHKQTPYYTTLFLDADTIILQNFDELFDLIKEHEFVVTNFAQWKTYKRIIANRIKSWQAIYPEKIEPAFTIDLAINTGIFGFTKDSSLMKDWYDLAKKGDTFFIPDETCCQLILPEYKHYIASNKYNTSCKYDTIDDSSKIIHFHGRKHCRLDNKGRYEYNSNLWYDEFKKIKDIEIVKQHINDDRQLRKNYDKWISQ